MLKNWWTALLDILYPPHCPSCRSSVNVQGEWCQRCMPNQLSLRELAPSGRLPAALDCCFTILPYDGTTKQLLHRLKFRPDPRVARYFEWLLNNKVNWAKLGSPELVVPVPLSIARVAQRGFNQTALLFEPWCQRRGLLWGNVLARNRDTLPQWRLSSIERRQNIKGAFAVTQPKLVRGKTVMVVDDILTTGFTLAECARTLKRAGAREVYGLALASGAADR